MYIIEAWLYFLSLTCNLSVSGCCILCWSHFYASCEAVHVSLNDPLFIENTVHAGSMFCG